MNIEKNLLPEEMLWQYIDSIYCGKIIKNENSIIVNPRTNLNLELDLYLPEMRKAIDYYNAWAHSQPSTKSRDRNKRIQCKKKDISLLIINEYDWYNEREKCFNKINRFIFGNTKSKRSSKYYLSNDELIEELIDFKKTGVASEDLGLMFLQISKGLSKRSNFAGYTWLSDMVGEALLTCIKYSRKFDEDKSDNAFGYISTICYKSFQAYLNKQKKHSNIKDICFRYKDDLSENTPSNHDLYDTGNIGIDYTFLSDINKQELKMVKEDEEFYKGVELDD